MWSIHWRYALDLCCGLTHRRPLDHKTWTEDSVLNFWWHILLSVCLHHAVHGRNVVTTEATICCPKRVRPFSGTKTNANDAVRLLPSNFAFVIGKRKYWTLAAIFMFCGWTMVRGAEFLTNLWAKVSFNHPESMLVPNTSRSDTAGRHMILGFTIAGLVYAAYFPIWLSLGSSVKGEGACTGLLQQVLTYTGGHHVK